MRHWAIALAVTGLMALPGVSRAQSALLFETAHLAGVEAGSSLDYDVHAIRVNASSGAATDIEGDIALATSAGTAPEKRNIEAVLTRDGRSRTLPPFNGVQGNPVVIIFLEQVLQDLSQATGGSATYLRNRLREGLAEGLTEETGPDGTRLVMRPFAEDPNQDALGPYATLEIHFVIDDTLPGMVRELSAKAGPADAPVFLEEVTYDDES